MERDQRVMAFDLFGWKLSGGNEDDKSDFWKPARVLYVNQYHPDLVTINWDEYGGTSHGHRISDLRPIKEIA